MVLEGVEDLEADVLLLSILAILLFVFELLLVTEDAEAEALEDADATEPETEEAEAAEEIESAELWRLDGFDFDALEAVATDVEEVDALLLLDDAQCSDHAVGPYIGQWKKNNVVWLLAVGLVKMNSVWCGFGSNEQMILKNLMY